MWAYGLSLPLAGGQYEATAEEIETCAAKYLALEHLQTVDVSFDGAVAPGQRHPRFDGRIVVVQPLRKALHDLQRTRAGAFQPRLHVRGLPQPHKLRKVLRQIDRLGHLGRLRVELGELL